MNSIIRRSLRRASLKSWICHSCRSHSPFPPLVSSTPFSTEATPFEEATSRTETKLETETETKTLLPRRTRFAPSPTGYLHLGSLRTALFSYCMAKASGGQFILRIEDTDQKRTIKDSELRLCEDLKWAGLEWDEGPHIGGPYGPYRQSERTELYQEHAQKLLESGHAYRCFCTADRLRALAEIPDKGGSYDRRCLGTQSEESDERASKGEAHVIRLKCPKFLPRLSDFVSPKARFQNTLKPRRIGVSPFFNDVILIKSDGFPTYHFANVVDDHHMKITHVVRGTEWVPSTPMHLAIYEAFGWEPPAFGHVGLLMNQDSVKLSKRNGDVDNVADLRDQGILPESLLNFAAILGASYHAKGGPLKDSMTLPDIVEAFKTGNQKFTRGDVKVDFRKLYYFNRYHVENLVQENKNATELIHCIKKAMSDLESNPLSGSSKALTEIHRYHVENLVQENKNATELIHCTKKAMSDLESNPLSGSSKALTEILAGRDETAYINDILRWDGRNFSNAPQWVQRNKYLFTRPTEEVLDRTFTMQKDKKTPPSFQRNRDIPGVPITQTDLAVYVESFLSQVSADIEAQKEWSREYIEETLSHLKHAEARRLTNATDAAVNVDEERPDEPGQWNKRQELGNVVLELASKIGYYMRWVTLASEHGPSVLRTLLLLGREETMRRCEMALKVARRRLADEESLKTLEGESLTVSGGGGEKGVVDEAENLEKKDEGGEEKAAVVEAENLEENDGEGEKEAVGEAENLEDNDGEGEKEVVEAEKLETKN